MGAMERYPTASTQHAIQQGNFVNLQLLMLFIVYVTHFCATLTLS